MRKSNELLLPRGIETVVSLERIVSDDVKTRPLKEESIEELMASFRAKGQQQAIKLRPRDDWMFKVTFGEHRMEAASRLAKKGVPIKGLPVGTIKAVIEESDEHEALEQKVTENAHRNGFVDPWEEGGIFARLLQEKYDGSIDALSEAIGKKTSYISDRTRVFHLLDPSLRKYVGHELTVANTIALARYESTQDQIAAAQIIVRTRTQNLGHGASWGGLGGTVKVRTLHECTCGCGNVHAIDKMRPFPVEVGEGASATIGTSRKDTRVHIENPAQAGYSFCGHQLSRKWVTELPEDPSALKVSENVKETRDVCEMCAKAWRAPR